MRLFIAITVPHELHRYCTQLQSQLPDLKTTQDFHLTLQFLGDDIKDSEPIIKALSKIKFRSFEIEMGDAAPFPNSFNPKGVWIECDPSAALLKLVDEVHGAMSELGYMVDRPFRAHITLGRYKQPPNQKPTIIKGGPHRFTMGRFYLMESALTPDGSKYKTVAQFPE